jgi:hypothetical protein
MPKAETNHTLSPEPDADLRALTCEHFTVSNMLRAWEAGELDLDQDAADAAVTRWWEVTDAIADTPAHTDRGRRAKLQCAYAACRGVSEAAPRRFALIASALADMVGA